MDKLRSLIYRKTKPNHTLGNSLLEETDTDVIHDKIYIIMKRMKEIEDEMEQMKKESVVNKKRIRNLRLLLEEKEETILLLKEKSISHYS